MPPLSSHDRSPDRVRPEDLLFDASYCTSGVGFLRHIERMKQAATSERPIYQIRNWDTSTFFSPDADYLVGSDEPNEDGVALRRFCNQRSADLVGALIELGYTRGRAMPDIGAVLPHVHLDGLFAGTISTLLQRRSQMPAKGSYIAYRRRLSRLYEQIGADPVFSYSGLLHLMRDVALGSPELEPQEGDSSFVLPLKRTARAIPRERAVRVLEIAAARFTPNEIRYNWPEGLTLADLPATA